MSVFSKTRFLPSIVSRGLGLGFRKPLVAPRYLGLNVARQQPSSFFQASFCSTAPMNSNKSLVEVLEEEIKAETELARKNMEGRESPSIEGFTIKTEDATVTLTKTYESEKITVTFNVNNSMDQQGVDPDNMEHGEDPNLEPPAIASRPSFVVDVEKAGQKLSFECNSGVLDEEHDGGIKDGVDVINVCIYNAKEKLEDKVYVAETVVMDQNLYGPLMDFLDERGIHNEFVGQLVEFATHYEHAQYVNMLKKIKNFLSA